MTKVELIVLVAGIAFVAGISVTAMIFGRTDAWRALIACAIVTLAAIIIPKEEEAK